MRKKTSYWKDDGEYTIAFDDQCKNILNQLPSLLWFIDVDNNISYMNKAAAEFLEGSDIEFQDGLWVNYIHPEDKGELLEKWGEALVKREAISYEYRILHKGLGYRWLSICNSPYHDEDGDFMGYIVIASDITAQRESDDILKRYELLSKNTRDIILFFDLSGKIVEANKAAVAAYGYAYDELCSMTIRDLSEEWNYTAIMMEQANEKGIFFQTIHKRKDGSYLYVEVSSQGADIGGRRLLLNIIRDITDREKAEKELKKSHSSYRSLFMNLNSGYACFKIINDENNNPVDAKILEFNDIFTKYFNLSKDNVVNHYMSEASPKTLVQALGFIIENKRELYRGECVRKDCLYVPSFDMWLSLSVYSPEEEKIILIVTDITEQKKKENAFLSNVSHEIRNPLNGTVGMMDLLNAATLTKDQREKLNMAKECTNSLTYIIDDTLDFEKLETDHGRGNSEAEQSNKSADSSAAIKLKELLMDINIAESAMKYNNPEIVAFILKDMSQISGVIGAEGLCRMVRQMEHKLDKDHLQDTADCFNELKTEVRKILEEIG